MDKVNRVKDLTVVFDEQWKSDHAVNSKDIKEKDKSMNDRMFGSNEKKNNFSRVEDSITSRVNRLNEKIESAKDIAMVNKMDNIKRGMDKK